MISGKVFIVDDDDSVRRSLSLLLKSAGYQVESFAGAEDLIEYQGNNSPGCIILDIFLEGKSGLESQEDISRKFAHHPIIYLTGRGDIPMSVMAMKKGAVNFLQKPVDDLTLLSEVEEALNLSRTLFIEQEQTNHFKSLVDSLTPREVQIFRLLITGLLNKQIAAELNIAEHTVKLHRGKITEKLGLKSVAEMVHLAEKLKIV
jgi:FixJ family two-component response regulator